MIEHFKIILNSKYQYKKVGQILEKHGYYYNENLSDKHGNVCYTVDEKNRKLYISFRNNYSYITFLHYEYEKCIYDEINLRELTFKEFVNTYAPIKELRRKKLKKLKKLYGK